MMPLPICCCRQSKCRRSSRSPNRKQDPHAPNNQCSTWANKIMDLDKDDLAVLCARMTKDEVDRVHRLLHEWNIGPDSSFPVQLALLTCAQLRAAASVPRSLNDSQKWLELHLAEYRQQTAALIKNFGAASDSKIEVFEGTIQKHSEA